MSFSKFKLINLRVANNIRKYGESHVRPHTQQISQKIVKDEAPSPIKGDEDEVIEDFKPTIGDIRTSDPTFTPQKNEGKDKYIHSEEVKGEGENSGKKGLKESIVKKASSGLHFISARNYI